MPIELTNGQEVLQRGAKVCLDVAVPNVKDTFNWRYGCFCGKNYPDIKAEGRSLEGVISDYIRIRPKDAIDEACQQHDLCWLKYGENNGKCNDNLKYRMKELRRLYSQLEGMRGDSISLSRNDIACWKTANDILLAFSLIVVPSKFDNNTEGAIKAFRNLTAGSLMAGYMFVIRRISPEYPSPNERCDDRDLKRVRKQLEED